MEALQFWLDGFATALTPTNLAFAFIGCVLGTMVGVLPGLGPAAGTAILIPITFVLDPIPAIIMLSAIYYGAMYGGTITSVLVNVPGEAASVVTCFDGYQMAKQGRAGKALGIAAIGSFIGGTFATFALMVVALPMAQLALKFGPPELFALLLVGLCLATGLAGRSLLTAILMTAFGLILATVGLDPIRGAPRLTFDLTPLFDGVGLIPVVMGLFGVGEILLSIENPIREVIKTKFSNIFPSREEWKLSGGAIGRGTLLGFFLGLIPGVSSIIPTFVSYIVEKRVSKHPEKFGTGVIEGVAGPETANNAYANGAMIPLFTLGIPGSPTLAVLFGAFTIQGLIPGPTLFRDNPNFVWAVIASFYIGNVILLVLNLPLVGLWAKLLEIPYHYLYPGILLFVILGVYSLRQNVFDIGVMLVFSVLGYIFRKLDWPVAPTILALILGPMMESQLRTSLQTSAGDFSIFITHPISAGLILLAVAVLVFSGMRTNPGKKAAEQTCETP